MNLISAAMRRTITVLVGIIAVALGAMLALQRMPVDIFPDLGTPIIYVAQPYGGMDPGQMEGFLTSYYEYHFLYITGIEHVESKSIQGVALCKLYFHPGTDMSTATDTALMRPFSGTQPTKPRTPRSPPRQTSARHPTSLPSALTP